jgi:Meiotically up-regulated gene 113
MVALSLGRAGLREQIIKAIRRLTEASGGKVPGRRLFERETGIKESDWYGVYWVRWSEAIAEAGLVPNIKRGKTDEQFYLKKLAEAFRHYGRVPTVMELRIYRKNIDPTLPNDKTVISNFQSKANMLRSLADWTSAHDEFADVAAMLTDRMIPQLDSSTTNAVEGYVYLIGSGTHYKIGRSDQIERRVKQIRVSLPEVSNLVHAIRTDDPAGIEAYWHRRFAERRANGEWFKLTKSDLAAFKRRKFQ